MATKPATNQSTDSGPDGPRTFAIATSEKASANPQFPVTWIDESASEFGRVHDDGHTGMTPPKQPRTL